MVLLAHHISLTLQEHTIAEPTAPAGHVQEASVAGEDSALVLLPGGMPPA